MFHSPPNKNIPFMSLQFHHPTKTNNPNTKNHHPYNFFGVPNICPKPKRTKPKIVSSLPKKITQLWVHLTLASHHPKPIPVVVFLSDLWPHAFPSASEVTGQRGRCVGWLVVSCWFDLKVEILNCIGIPILYS